MTTAGDPARPAATPHAFQKLWDETRCPADAAAIEAALARNLKIRLGIRPDEATRRDLYLSLAYTVRDLTIDRYHAAAATPHPTATKRVGYLSMEFLIGRLLVANVINLGIGDAVARALTPLGTTLLELSEFEPEAGLGNGGLGRLAACFLESLATHGYPATGYGICYQHGMFRQDIVDGRQVERLDNWLKSPSPWMITRSELAVPVDFFGRIENGAGHDGSFLPKWVETEPVLGVPRDLPVVGYGGRFVNLLRLWSATSTAELDLELFNQGDYVGAARKKAQSESISKILYPNDNVEKGRELRLMQEYFFVACSIADVTRDYLSRHHDIRGLPGSFALQMNDTHPALTVVELMRVLVDGHRLDWPVAWDIVVRTLGYTNHTLLPEALEKWPVTMLGHVLPRHLQIIREINRRFLEEIAVLAPKAAAEAAPLSTGPDQQVRMAHLAVIGSHATNGVSKIHTELLERDLFPEFKALLPTRFSNKTNGVTQRVWILQANPRLAALLTEKLGPGWITDLEQLQGLRAFEDDAATRADLATIKAAAKRDAAAYVRGATGIPVEPAMLFDVHIKRLHEYKRQLMNAIGTLVRYRRLKNGSGASMVPRAVLLAGKSAPGYAMAKLILRFICRVADVVNQDAAVKGRLAVAFLPDYNVSLAERLIPAADLSQQISTAGCEASGTGNMKFAMNGALTLGTLDGANIEMRDAIGADAFFQFGYTVPEIAAKKAQYAPRVVLDAHPEIAEAVAMLADGSLSPADPTLFQPLHHALVEGDRYFVLGDLPGWLEAQDRVDALYADQDAWLRWVVRNIAAMGPFSSDRAVREYARDTWDVRSVFE